MRQAACLWASALCALLNLTSSTRSTHASLCAALRHVLLSHCAQVASHKHSPYRRFRPGQHLRIFRGSPAGRVSHALQAPPPALHLLFETPDLDTAYAKAVTAGAVSLKPPETKSCGRTMAYVRDPHGGVLIELLQELVYPFFLKAASAS